MKNKPAYYVARMGMLFALAITLSFVESTLTPMLGLLPAVRIGLANIVVMFALLQLGSRPALLLVILKAMFALLTRGATAGFLSLLGGGLSLLTLWLLLRLPFKLPGAVFSAAGALTHNMGQLAGASLIFSNALIWSYTPILIISGLIVGMMTWALYSVISPYLSRISPH